MSFVSTKQLLKIARNRGYGLGFFTVNTLEMIQAVIESAEELRSPVVLAPWQEDVIDTGFGYIESLCIYAINKSAIPASLHLDHGTNYEFLAKCMANNYSSVMIDASTKPYEENVTITKKVVDLAKILDISVEGEVGTIASTWEMSSEEIAGIKFTDPDEAERYVKDTGVDCLAVSIGTKSGAFMERPKIDFDLLERIRSKIPEIHLVIHGGSSCAMEDMQRFVKLGVTYMKFGSVIRDAFFRKIDEIRKTTPYDMLDTRYILTPAKDAAKKVIKERIRRLGSDGRAADKCDFACLKDNSYKREVLKEKDINNKDILKKVEEITAEVIKKLKS